MLYSDRNNQKLLLSIYWLDKKNVRENRMRYQQFTIQRYWQHWSNKTQEEDIKTKNTKTKKTKYMNNLHPTKNRGWTRATAKDEQFLPVTYDPKDLSGEYTMSPLPP